MEKYREQMIAVASDTSASSATTVTTYRELTLCPAQLDVSTPLSRAASIELCELRMCEF